MAYATCAKYCRAEFKMATSMKDLAGVVYSAVGMKSRHLVARGCVRCVSTSVGPPPPTSTDAVPPVDPPASPPPAGNRQAFRTSESNPINHTWKHVGQFYSIPLTDVPTLFPIGLSSRWQKLLRPFQEASIMVRKPAVEIMEYLKQTDFTNPPVKYVMYGRKGSGKTMCFNHLLHYCQAQGWLMVHVPCANSWNVNNKWDFLDSVSHEGMYDQPIMSAEWLKHFRFRNEDFLKKNATSDRYVWSKREQTEQGEPLLAVVDQGMNRPKNATDAIGVILKELQLQSSAGNFRLILAIKAVNGLFAEATNIRKPGGYMIPVRELTLMHHFKKALKGNWTNGAIITTVDQHNSYKAPKDDFKPLYLLQKQGFEWLDPFVPIYVENYTDKEFESCLQYYFDRHWIQTDQAKTEEGKLHLKLLTECNPGALERICSSL